MTQPRKRLVSYADTIYYHCVARCVRRAFLCGKDPVTGFDFEHRRAWIVERLQELSTIFAIDLCAYTVMNNHYHVVLRVNLEQARSWSSCEVVEQWNRLFKGHVLVQRWKSDSQLDEATRQRALEIIEVYRERLCNLSWFMRCLNESIARMANREDRCNGRFWEGRFKSQALLDERALLAVMAYVDLNPVRAGIAKIPEQSEYTSIRQRLEQPKKGASGNSYLRPFSGQADDCHGIPYRFKDYLELVDWAGRVVRHGKIAHIPPDSPPILRRLGMDPSDLVQFLVNKQDYPRAIGPVERLRSLAVSMVGRFLKGTEISRRLCPEPA